MTIFAGRNVSKEFYSVNSSHQSKYFLKQYGAFFIQFSIQPLLKVPMTHFFSTFCSCWLNNDLLNWYFVSEFRLSFFFFSYHLLWKFHNIIQTFIRGSARDVNNRGFVFFFFCLPAYSIYYYYYYNSKSS